MNIPQDSSWLIGAWTVTPSTGAITGPSGAHRLEPKVMAVLACLIEAQGRVVSKHDLLSRVWPDTFVEEVALARAVSEIRRVLGDDARSPRYVGTIPRIGYRLLVLPKRSPAEAPHSPVSIPRRRVWDHYALAGVLAIAMAGIWIARRPAPPASVPVIAVLPFENLGAEEDRHLAAGVTDDVTAALTRVDGLRVIARTSVDAVLTGRRDITRIAGRLGASAILDGSVRRDGSRIRIVAKLIEPSGQLHLWTDVFDRPIDELFDVQRQVSFEIARAINARVAMTARHGDSRRPRLTGDGYDRYLRAMTAYGRTDRPGLAESIALLQRVVADDPEFALARAALADGYARLFSWDGDPALARRALEEAERAAASDPTLAEAHKAVGHAWGVQGRYDRAAPAYERAIALNSGYWPAVNNLALTYGQQGDLDKAYPLSRRAAELDPARALPLTNAGLLSQVLGLDDEARRMFMRAVAIDPNYVDAVDGLFTLGVVTGRSAHSATMLTDTLERHPACRVCLVDLGILAELRGEADEARTYFARALALPGDRIRAYLGIARAELIAGERAAADARIGVVLDALNRTLAAGSGSWRVRWYLAAAHAMRGDLDEAARWYGASIDAGRRDARWDAIEPLLRPLKPHPEFQKGLHRARQLVLQMRRRVVAGY